LIERVEQRKHVVLRHVELSSKRSGSSVRAPPELTSVPAWDRNRRGRHRRRQTSDTRPVVRTDAIEHLRQLQLGGDQVLADGLFSVVRHLGRLGPMAPLIPPDRLAKKPCGFLTETFVIS
jgi:hypothetical protein